MSGMLRRRSYVPVRAWLDRAAKILCHDVYTCQQSIMPDALDNIRFGTSGMQATNLGD